MRSDIDPSEAISQEVLGEVVAQLEPPVGLTTSLQYVDALAGVREMLEARGVRCIVGRGRRVHHDGQVLGCDVSAATSIADRVNSFLHVGSGRFHALGVAVATRRPTVLLDLETGRVECVNIEGFLRVRYGIISKAMSAERIGVLIGLKAGQRRLAHALRVRDELEERGIRAYLLPVDVVTPDVLRSFGLDAYISALCPRVALDDQAMFDVPVLTLTEARILMDLNAEYEFDQI
jgi:2-(3-amino-3-carboxypropyl)histidine synthase